jgi:nitrogenase molybdenum-iron protein NifN
MGLKATDDLVMTLASISGSSVPARLERHRAQLQGTMLDTHFMLGQARFAMAADPDLINAFSHLLKEMGAEVVVAIASSRAAVLEQVPVAQVKIGDLEDLEHLARSHQAEVVIGSSHATQSVQRLGLPHVRAGFPLYDQIGAYQRTWIGYRGTRQTLFDLANVLMDSTHHKIQPYYSRYSQKLDYRQEVVNHDVAKASADCGRQH